MAINYLAELELDDAGVHATVVNRDAYEGVREGRGLSVTDAMADALNERTFTFATEGDERDACVAAMRSFKITFEVTEDGRVVNLEFA